METETMDKLYLELSQFTQAKTHRELRLEAENAKLREVVQITQELVDDYTIVDKRLKAALAALLEGK